MIGFVAPGLSDVIRRVIIVTRLPKIWRVNPASFNVKLIYQYYYYYYIIIIIIIRHFNIIF